MRGLPRLMPERWLRRLISERQPSRLMSDRRTRCHLHSKVNVN